ncbi:hypothetical protein [Lactococcus lactis]|uniref:Uncharacterized protein n=1 Tax=Lactococcus lactis TaxID=1358 RepID=A0AAW5TK94_9LACT|nr:hypothetical protein [Lactococcus lactis]MCW2279872.1 hypothetical protein [Lactococcus lactis]MCW2280416.1 hypothetical protein [Lactococcus lactis]
MVNTGFSVSDILANDFETTLEIVTSSSEENSEVSSEKEEVMTLGEFMNQI